MAGTCVAPLLWPFTPSLIPLLSPSVRGHGWSPVIPFVTSTQCGIDWIGSGFWSAMVAFLVNCCQFSLLCKYSSHRVRKFVGIAKKLIPGDIDCRYQHGLELPERVFLSCRIDPRQGLMQEKMASHWVIREFVYPSSKSVTILKSENHLPRKAVKRAIPLASKT